MADEQENYTSAALREIRSDNGRDEERDRIAGDVRDLKMRQIATEETLSGVNRRLDRLDLHVERIEKRIDLVAA